MKDVFLVYDASCFYEIIILNYFMAFSKCDVLLCSPEGSPVRTMEGYSVNVDCALGDVDLTQVRSFVVPGGRIAPIDTPYVWACLRELEDLRGTPGTCRGAEKKEACASNLSREEIEAITRAVLARLNAV